jgi:Family of unknown function (DUF5681)
LVLGSCNSPGTGSPEDSQAALPHRVIGQRSGANQIQFPRGSINLDVEANAFKQRRPGAVRGFSMKEADDMSGFKKGKRRRSKTDNTNGQQKPWLFKPGQSGNPAGRPKGSRNKLAEDFLSDAYQQWQQSRP